MDFLLCKRRSSSSTTSGKVGDNNRGSTNGELPFGAEELGGVLSGEELLSLVLTTIVSALILGFGLFDAEFFPGSDILTFGICRGLLSRSAGNGDNRGGILRGFSNFGESLLSAGLVKGVALLGWEEDLRGDDCGFFSE